MARQSIALNRFGLGARAGEAAPRDPRGWLLDQFAAYDPRPAPIAAQPGSAAIMARMDAAYAERRQARNEATERAMLMPATAGAQGNPLRQFRQDYMAAVAARTGAALTTPTPFVERLVHFWANHFAVSVDKVRVAGLAGPFEFEAIRPNVLGRFSDLLLAVERHPAMLLYLDQAQSIGPDSPAGQRISARGQRNAGLNENLAREILELHTLGVRSGYGQDDVTALARALTGWTVRIPGRARRVAAAPGAFVFAPMFHQPGTVTVLGKPYSQPGEAQGRAILAELAVHPATARHVATKLARHFVADEPPTSLVARLERAFLTTGGDLPSIYRALVEAPEAWAEAPAKFRTPWQWGVAAMRASGLTTLPGRGVAGLFQQLGQPIWRPGSPAGWNDTAASWAAPDALVRRVEAAERIAGRSAPADARALAAQLFPDTLTPATRTALARAESPAQALALLLAAPEMMRS